ncbi:MAG: hypothetical protein AAFV07_17015, partial [Bacteroidota bacterium]
MLSFLCWAILWQPLCLLQVHAPNQAFSVPFHSDLDSLTLKLADNCLQMIQDTARYQDKGWEVLRIDTYREDGNNLWRSRESYFFEKEGHSFDICAYNSRGNDSTGDWETVALVNPVEMLTLYDAHVNRTYDSGYVSLISSVGGETKAVEFSYDYAETKASRFFWNKQFYNHWTSLNPSVAASPFDPPYALPFDTYELLVQAYWDLETPGDGSCWVRRTLKDGRIEYNCQTEETIYGDPDETPVNGVGMFNGHLTKTYISITVSASLLDY